MICRKRTRFANVIRIIGVRLHGNYYAGGIRVERTPPAIAMVLTKVKPIYASTLHLRDLIISRKRLVMVWTFWF